MQKPAVTVMVKAARQAGNVILRHIGRLDSLNVVEKARQDYASEVDSLAEAEIIRELKRAFPDHAFLGEEGGQVGKSRHTFVIDPLDGTSNFLRGLPHFCVSIALYAILRFLLEFLRADDRGDYGLMTSQWISLGLLVAVGFAWTRFKAHAEARRAALRGAPA